MKTHTKGFLRSIAPMMLVATLVMTGCGGTGQALEGPQVPEYDSAIAEANDLPERLEAQVDWALEPIHDAARIAHELAAVRAEVNLDPAKFEELCKAAFSGGEGVALDGIDAAAKAKLEASLQRLRKVGEDLKSVPNRVGVASKNVVKITMQTPLLVRKATKEAQDKLTSASAQDKVKLAQEIEDLRGLPVEMKALVPKIKDKVTSLPEEATAATKDLVAVFAGQPPSMPLPDPKPGELPQVAEPPTRPEKEPAAVPDTPDVVVASLPRDSVLFGPPPAQFTLGVHDPGRARSRVADLIARADALLEQGDATTAARVLEQAYYLAPRWPELAMRVAETAYRAKDCGAARAYFAHVVDRALQADWSPLPAMVDRATRLMQTPCAPRTSEDGMATAETYTMRAEQVEPEDPHEAARWFVAAYLAAPQRHELTVSIVRTALAANDCRTAGTYVDHFSMVVTGENVNRIKKDMAKVRASAGSCTPLRSHDRIRRASAYYVQGRSYELMLAFRDARARYQWALELEPDNPTIRTAFARAAWYEGDCSTAKAAVDRLPADTTGLSGGDAKWIEETRQLIERHGCRSARWSKFAPVPDRAQNVTDSMLPGHPAPRSNGRGRPPPAPD